MVPSNKEKECTVVSIGLQCAVPAAMGLLGRRGVAFPFDWMWSPGSNSYETLRLLLRDGEGGVDAALRRLLRGIRPGPFRAEEDGRFFVSSSSASGGLDAKTQGMQEARIDTDTGFGVSHYDVDDPGFAPMLRRRLERLRSLLLPLYERESEGEEEEENKAVVLAFADAGNADYTVDGVAVGGADASEWLARIRALLPSPRVEIVHFCRRRREMMMIEEVKGITRVPFDPAGGTGASQVSVLVANHFLDRDHGIRVPASIAPDAEIDPERAFFVDVHDMFEVATPSFYHLDCVREMLRRRSTRSKVHAVLVFGTDQASSQDSMNAVRSRIPGVVEAIEACGARTFAIRSYNSTERVKAMSELCLLGGVAALTRPAEGWLAARLCARLCRGESAAVLFVPRGSVDPDGRLFGGPPVPGWVREHNFF